MRISNCQYEYNLKNWKNLPSTRLLTNFLFLRIQSKELKEYVLDLRLVESYDAREYNLKNWKLLLRHYVHNILHWERIQSKELKARWEQWGGSSSTRFQRIQSKELKDIDWYVKLSLNYSSKEYNLKNWKSIDAPAGKTSWSSAGLGIQSKELKGTMNSTEDHGGVLKEYNLKNWKWQNLKSWKMWNWE